MRTTILMAGMTLLFLFSEAQPNLNWAASFSPTWSDGNTNGNASNVGGSGINCTATLTMVGGGVFTNALGGSGAQTPTVSGATFTIPATTNRIQVTPNFSSNTSYVNIVLSFSSYTTNVTFKIVDIDKNNPNTNNYYDRVTVTGTDGVTTYNASLSKYDAVTDPNFLVISGNSASVNTTNGQADNTASDATDQRGTINVSFGSAVINSITIRYDNAPGSISNPAAQAIAVGSVSFNASTLPVNLLSFSGHKQLQNVLLNWSTQQEINAASFDIERNSNGNWETIGNVIARGNNNTVSNYNYTDINPQGSVLLYRLKQIDIDGNFKYSTIIRIISNATTDITSYPNPFNSLVNVSVSSTANQQVTISLYDAAGRNVQSQIKNLYTGNNSFSIAGLDRLTTGIYYLVIKDSNAEILARTKLLKD